MKSEGCIDIGISYAENCAKLNPPVETSITDLNEQTMSENVENAPLESENNEVQSVKAKEVDKDDDEIEAEVLENVSLNVSNPTFSILTVTYFTLTVTYYFYLDSYLLLS